MTDVYEIIALRYATHMRGPAHNFLYQNDLPDLHDSGMPLDYFVWVLRNKTRTVIVDTGFTPETAALRDRQILVAVPEALRAANVDAGDVEDVIITHLHYDHAGGLAAFPKARIHIQDTEVEYATGRHMCHAQLRMPYDVEDVVTLVRRLYEGRVHFVDGDSEIFPGISVHRVPGHTPGLQCVRVLTERGAVVLASDASHFYANMERQNPFPILSSLPDMMDSWKRLYALADSSEHIVPGHDPEVLRRYPSAGIPGVASALLHSPPHRASV